jgi:hypothetical protein
MPSPRFIRPVNKLEYEAWLPLWDGYNAFYGRQGQTALELTVTPHSITFLIIRLSTTLYSSLQTYEKSNHQNNYYFAS